MVTKYPVYTPDVTREDVAAATAVVASGHISGSSGPSIEEFESTFARYCGCEYGVAVNSGTAALHLAAIIVGVQPGSDVLVSALTNIATANAIVQCGGRVIPVDSDPETWNLDAHLLHSVATPKTVAVVPVHIYGHPADMPSIRAFARTKSLTVIEDAAEAHGARISGRRVGGMSHVGCFSFYSNKVITTGEGGMLTTNDADIADRARSLRNLAFGYPRFLHREIGFNYRMSNVAAAIGLSQLRRIDRTISAKRALAARYTIRLSGIPYLQLPVELDGYHNIYWMYCVVLRQPAPTSRGRLIAHLSSRGIETRTMFCPLNLQPALLARGLVSTESCPVAENLWANGLYLPSTPSLTDSDLDYICDTIREVLC